MTGNAANVPGHQTVEPILIENAMTQPLQNEYGCQGIVFKREKSNEYTCSFRRYNDLVVYPAVDGAVDPNAPDTAGQYVFLYANPPSPPHHPIGASCQAFYQTPHAELAPEGSADPGMAIVLAVSINSERAYRT